MNIKISATPTNYQIIEGYFELSALLWMSVHDRHCPKPKNEQKWCHIVVQILILSVTSAASLVRLLTVRGERYRTSSHMDPICGAYSNG